MAPSFVNSLLLLSVAVAVAAQETTDENNGPVAGYIPKVWAAVVGIVLYAASGVWLWIKLFRDYRRNRYMLTLCIGMTTMALGFVLRIAYGKSSDSIGIYAIMMLLLLLSPCAFIATAYILLKHIATAFDDDVAADCLIIRRTWVVRIFVSSDVFTFLLQASGGGMTATRLAIGETISLIALVLQLISYCLFLVVLSIFSYRMYKRYPVEWRSTRAPSGRDWRTVLWILIPVSVAIVVRSLFRCIEFSQGYDGYLPTHEGYFYLLDALPLWLAMNLFIFFYPPHFIEPHHGNRVPSQEIPMTTSWSNNKV